MIYIDGRIFDILNFISEGIIIVNEQFEIVFMNQIMKDIINAEGNPAGHSLIRLVPGLNRNYFIKAIKHAIQKDHRFFFSSVLHQGLLTDDAQVNINIRRAKIEGSKYAIIESVNISSQVIRVNQLKEYANELRALNKKLVEQEKEITFLAYHDGLTGLANRTFFYNMAQQIIQDAKRNEKKLGLMFIDIDEFKCINDNFGHKIGDQVLTEVAKILKASIRKNDIVARHGGDEFLILLTDFKSFDDYQTVAARIKDANRSIKIKNDLNIDISLSIGISFYPRDSDNIDKLILKADQAMYRSKKSGGDRCTKYFGIKQPLPG